MHFKPLLINKLLIYSVNFKLLDKVHQCPRECIRLFENFKSRSLNDLKKTFKSNLLQRPRMALLSSKNVHYGWRIFSNSTIFNVLEWLLLVLRNFTIVEFFFKIRLLHFSNALECLFLALRKLFTMVEEDFQTPPSPTI